MKKFLLIFLLLSCTPSTQNNNFNYKSLNFDKNLTFFEFKDLLEKYNYVKGYPNIED